MIVTLSDGSKHSIEKNQRVKIKKKNRIKHKSKTECRTVSNLNIPVETFVTKAEKNNPNFYRYSAHRFNCQRFVNDLLTRNGIKNLSSFVKQDAKELLTPFTKKLAQAATDVAGVVDYGLSGGKRDERDELELWIMV